MAICFGEEGNSGKNEKLYLLYSLETLFQGVFTIVLALSFCEDLYFAGNMHVKFEASLPVCVFVCVFCFLLFFWGGGGLTDRRMHASRQELCSLCQAQLKIKIQNCRLSCF